MADKIIEDSPYPRPPNDQNRTQNPNFRVPGTENAQNRTPETEKRDSQMSSEGQKLGAFFGAGSYTPMLRMTRVLRIFRLLRMLKMPALADDLAARRVALLPESPKHEVSLEPAASGVGP